MSSLPPPSPNPRFSTLASPPRPPPSSSSALAFASPSSRPDPPIDDALARDFPDVAQLSREDLQLLLEDPAYFDAYFNTMPEALALHRQVESATRRNLELADQSQAMKPELDRLRHETEALFTEATDLKLRWSYLDQAQHDAYKRFSPVAQLARYRAAATAQEHLCDSLVSSFLDGAGDEESFVKQYREVRKVHHKRQIGLQKWEEGKVVWET
ncbi:SPOSA6832_03287 [Sporobolomyces salmonicolor]|uniref:SPOSA6832_03287-mRNA-1:cds n=1 Tax=Sporidiobolus salmonicolor TaxID=5005 RepID=A0A0D6ENL0_SPOSA|nr:SPOSA6832_03287 [Sporobolomyces salmonicolor]